MSLATMARWVVAAAALGLLFTGLTVLVLERRRARPAPVERDAGPLASANFVGILGFVAVGLGTAWWRAGTMASLPPWLDGAIRAGGMILLAAAGLLAAWGLRSLGGQMSSHAEVRPDTELVTAGAFRVVRHPLYLAVLLLWAGGALALASWFMAACTAALVPVLVARSRLEERMLLRHLGPAYAAYAARVPMLLPGWPGRARGAGSPAPGGRDPAPGRGREGLMLDAAVIFLAYAVGCSPFLLLLAGMAASLELHLSTGAALAWDAALSLAFFLQHSVMVRRPVKAAIARRVPARYVGALYAVASGAVLAAVVLGWQRTETWFSATGPLRWSSAALSALAAGGFVWGVASLRGFDPLGIRPILRHRRQRPSRPPELQLRGAYRWVRHPLYLCVLVLVWASPQLSADGLLLKVLWTAWIVVGTMLEERDLAAEMGPAYREYRRTVPMLIPWRRPAAPWTS